jgi:hypothetical protein
MDFGDDQLVVLQMADGAAGVDAEDRFHKLIDGGTAGESLNPLSHKAATHQVHDGGLMVACGFRRLRTGVPIDCGQ